MVSYELLKLALLHLVLVMMIMTMMMTMMLVAKPGQCHTSDARSDISTGFSRADTAAAAAVQCRCRAHNGGVLNIITIARRVKARVKYGMWLWQIWCWSQSSDHGLYVSAFM